MDRADQYGQEENRLPNSPEVCMTFKKGDKKKVEDKTSSSSEDWSATTPANMATSLKRIDLKKTPTPSQPQTTQIEATRKPTRARQSLLAKALGSPVPINHIEKKQFSIASPEKPTKTTQKKQNKPSITSFINGIGFERTP